MKNLLDILIPVYNEGDHIVAVLECFKSSVKTPFRVLICYDHEDDNTLPAVRGYKNKTFELIPVKNRSRGVHGAIMTGFQESDSDALLVYPADDMNNAGIIDRMVRKFEEGCDIVSASRFMKGGRMEGCRLLKSVLVRSASYTLHHFARIPTHDVTNGLRLFSHRLLSAVEIESRVGFAFSLELLVKCHRLGWKIGEVPALWIERKAGVSRFQILNWLPDYLRWYFYACATTFLHKSLRSPEVN